MSQSDFNRPLNGRGRKAAKRMGQFMQERPIMPDLVLCSPAQRTRETLALLEPALAGVPVRFQESLYEAGRSDILALLRDLEEWVESVLVIGHNPGLHWLVHDLCGEDGEPEAIDRIMEKYPTCALAELDAPLADWSHLGLSGVRLARFTRPMDLLD